MYDSKQCIPFVNFVSVKSWLTQITRSNFIIWVLSYILSDRDMVSKKTGNYKGLKALPAAEFNLDLHFENKYEVIIIREKTSKIKEVNFRGKIYK